jgi:hypothetical protein
MTTLLASQEAALEPVRTAMLRNAAEQAGRTVAEAETAAQVLLADAYREADAAIARARASGIAEAEPVAAAMLNRSMRAARSVALSAALAEHNSVAERIRTAVLALRDAPDYPRLRDDLAQLARQAAGTDAEINELPEGGVIARASGVVVDCSLPRLADLAVAALRTRIARLCGP